MSIYDELISFYKTFKMNVKRFKNFGQHSTLNQLFFSFYFIISGVKVYLFLNADDEAHLVFYMKLLAENKMYFTNLKINKSDGNTLKKIYLTHCDSKILNRILKLDKSHEILNNSDLNQGKSLTPFFDYLSAKILEEIRLTKNKCNDLNFLENKLTSMKKYESQLSRELLGGKVLFLDTIVKLPIGKKMTYKQKNQLLDYFPFTKNELNKIQNAGFTIRITKDYNKRREIKFVLDSFDKITKKLD